MAKLIDLTEQTFNNLTVIARAENGNRGNARWLCRCVCGNKVIVSANNLKSGAVKSCGCLRKPYATHRASNTPLYRMWISMIYRCENPKYFAYKYYGKRGITVCEEWHDFLVFKSWVDNTKPIGKYSLDRIDNNKSYCPSNCKWSSAKEQANNRRSNVLIEYQGDSHTLRQWSEIIGFDYKTVHNRIHKLKWSFEKAISEPIDIKKSSWKG